MKWFVQDAFDPWLFDGTFCKLDGPGVSFEDAFTCWWRLGGGYGPLSVFLVLYFSTLPSKPRFETHHAPHGLRTVVMVAAFRAGACFFAGRFPVLPHPRANLSLSPDTTTCQLPNPGLKTPPVQSASSRANSAPCCAQPCEVKVLLCFGVMTVNFSTEN